MSDWLKLKGLFDIQSGISAQDALLQQAYNQQMTGWGQIQAQQEAQKRVLEEHIKLWNMQQLEAFLKENNLALNKMKKLSEDIDMILDVVPSLNIESALKIYALTKAFDDLKFKDKFEDIVNS